MKKISIALVLIFGLFGCEYSHNSRIIDGEIIVELDSCEYIKTQVHGGHTYAHKGNCKFCELRQSQREWK